MVKKEFPVFMNKGIAMLLIAAMMAASCSMPQSGPGEISEAVLVSSSGRAIDLYLEEIRSLVKDDLPEMEGFYDTDGYGVAMRTMEEENGREYLEFALSSSRFTDAEEVFSAAEGLVPDEELEKLRAQAAEAEEKLYRAASPILRVLTPDQQEEFYNDLTALVIKSSVLLTAAIVYAFVPTTVLWGKVTAASAVAIAAGVLSATIMAIVEHYRADIDLEKSFGQWLEDVAKEPIVYWGLASSVINISSSLNRGPVLTSVILGIFAVFGIVDDAKALLETFDFQV